MVTHAPAIGRLADRRIDLAHGRLAQITEISTEEEIHFDHLLEQVWIFGEEGSRRRSSKCESALTGQDAGAHRRAAGNAWACSTMRESELALTATRRHRARDIVRRRRLAERLLTDTFSVTESEAELARLQVRTHHQPRTRPANLHLSRPSDHVPARQSDSPGSCCPTR